MKNTVFILVMVKKIVKYIVECKDSESAPALYVEGLDRRRPLMAQLYIYIYIYIFNNTDDDDIDDDKLIGRTNILL